MVKIVTEKSNTKGVGVAIFWADAKTSRTDENIGLTLTFKEDKIIRMEHRITVVRRGLDERKLMLQSWYKEQLAPHMPVVMRPIYRMEDSIISASAEWIAEVLVQEEGGRR